MEFDTEKALPSFLSIKFAENYLYRIGLSLFSTGSQIRNRFHNPFFISFIICVSILKSITAVLMKEDKYSLLLIGDYPYFLNGRYFLNAAIVLFGSLALSSQMLHYWKYYKNESPSYQKIFEMICGSVSPQSIGLINKEDIKQLLNKSRLMFKISKIVTMGAICAAFSVSGIPLIMNSSFPILMIEIVWALLFTSFGYFCTEINFIQMTYFYIICLYLKLKLRNANNNIRKSFDKKYRINNYRIRNILFSMDSIISEINTYNNDLWSKYLMIVLITVVMVLDLVLFQSIFGEMKFFFKIVVFEFSSTLFLLLIMLINTASSVSFEANKSYKLLNKLFISLENKKIFIFVKIKV
jgi:hypothetical protein